MSDPFSFHYQNLRTGIKNLLACNNSSKCFKLKDDMSSHILSEHNIQVSKCGKKYDSIEDVKMHVIQHSKQSKMNKLLRKLDYILSNIMSQRNKIYGDIQKCKGIFCKIFFSRFKRTLSHSSEFFKRLVNNVCEQRR